MDPGGRRRGGGLGGQSPSPTFAATPSPSIKAGWSPEEIDKLRDIEEPDFLELADELGRTKSSVEEMWRKIRREDARAAGHALRGHRRLADHLIQDRDRRAAARRQQTEADIFLGVPPPGFSALDRKRETGR